MAMAASLLLASGAAAADTRGLSAGITKPKGFGTLDRFYRGMQVQPLFLGHGLQDIPDYLTSGETDLRYQRNSNLTQEIPFADKITITRFLGGYSEQTLRQANLWDDQLGLQSQDYVTRDQDGTLRFHGDLIANRLAPYFDAGYKPADMTLSLSNIPWALARDGGLAGTWGQKNPLDSTGEWRATISQFMTDLSGIVGSEPLPRFKLGVEYDQIVSFNGTAEDYYSYYEATHEAIRSHSLEASIAPGEFTGEGVCRDEAGTYCVYDSKDLRAHTINHGIAPGYMPRSLYTIVSPKRDAAAQLPREIAKRAVDSYSRLPGMAREIHQFGLQGQPFTSDGTVGTDIAARAAAWEFISLMHLKRRIKPKLVNHWDTFVRMAGGRINLLNGSGFTRLLLDRYLGRSLVRLPFRGKSPERTEVGAFQFGKTAVVIAAYTPHQRAADVSVTIDLAHLPRALRNKPLKILRYSERNNVFLDIRRDLKAAGLLKSSFANCKYCVALPNRMATDTLAAQSLLLAKVDTYDTRVKRGLRFHKLSAEGNRIRRGSGKLSVKLSGNEIVVIELAR